MGVASQVTGLNNWTDGIDIFYMLVQIQES